LGIRSKAALPIFIALSLLLIVAGGLTFYTKPLWVNDQIIRVKLWHHGVHSKYVDVDGYNIHYFEAGPVEIPGKPETAGIPLVLIHGIGSRGEDWAPLMASFAAQGFHVYVPDLLGYGRSPQPDVEYSISLEEDIILKFMDTLQIEHADLGGWSMGGWIAIRLALDHPEMVDRLVVYDSAGIYFPPTFDASLFVPADPASFATLRHRLSPIDKPLPSFVIRDAIRRLQRNGWVIERSFFAMIDGKDLTDFRLADLHKPTLVVWGSVDQLIPIATGERMHREIPNSAFSVIQGCGHLAPGDCPQPVLKATVDFLKSTQ
jgi:pimeloyl-ACP methyl ester carboxylesterase